ncbi:MAG: cyclase family protein [Bacteroidales bacterium]|nr:cyclase family protein [Bacteroidales bacterium]
MKYIDLSHTFKKDMPVFPGDSIAELKQVAFFEKNGYNSYYLQSGMHVGTHIDAPFHMKPNGKKLSEIEPEHFIGKAKIIDVRGQNPIKADALNTIKIEYDNILLLYTAHDKYYRTNKYYKNFPVITTAFAELVIEKGIKIVGFDSPSPDAYPYDVHKLLFANDVLIIENLTGLGQLLNIDEFEIIALPVKFHSAGAPVRVVARF